VAFCVCAHQETCARVHHETPIIDLVLQCLAVKSVELTVTRVHEFGDRVVNSLALIIGQVCASCRTEAL